MLVQNEDNHHKFWHGEIVQTNGMYLLNTMWGRIGTKGQQKLYKFSSEWEARSKLGDKMSEKMRGGYHKVTQEQLAEMVLAAQALGTANKIEGIYWVHVLSDGYFRKVEEKEMFNPDIKVGLIAVVMQKKKENVERTFILMDEMFEVMGKTSVANDPKYANCMKFTSLQKVVEDDFITKLRDALAVMVMKEKK